MSASFQAILTVYPVFVVHLESGKNGYNPVSVLIGGGDQLFWSHVETILARGVPISTFNTITSHIQPQLLYNDNACLLLYIYLLIAGFELSLCVSNWLHACKTFCLQVFRYFV